MAPVIRILLRYFVGMLLLHGYISDNEYELIVNDHELAISIEIVLGLIIASLVEGVYLLARKLGWKL